MTPKDALRIPKTSSTERVIQLSAMRVFACIGIVVLHTVFAANEYFADTVSAGENLACRMTENNMMWAVPVFVMVTGVLQLNPGKPLSLRRLYGRYVLRILLALVACCLVFRVFDIIMDGEAFTAGAVLKAFEELITARCWGHLWYLYLLIGLYVLLPFYRRLTEHCTDSELLYLCGAFLLFVSIIPMIEGFGLHVGFYISESIIYPLYLFAGHMIYTGRLQISGPMGLLLLIGGTVCILILDYLKYGAGVSVPGELFGYASPLVIAQTMGVFTLLCKGWSCGRRTARFLETVDGCSFGIYLIHMAFIRLLFRYMQINPFQGSAAALLVGIIAGILILSFAVTWILKRIPGVRWVL
ncbi:MAG: acyltransferase [Firmicutes bacterium]|nr:acyltransferase [Bacillota bacterium]